jgi:hypothetical protein
MPLAPGAKPGGKPSLLKKDGKSAEIRVAQSPFDEDELQFQVDLKWDIPPGLTKGEFDPAQLRLQIRRNALTSTLRHDPDHDPVKE